MTQFIRDTETDLLFFHSSRVYFWGAIMGEQKKSVFDPELLYVAAMFHDLGLTATYRNSQRRFEVDGADAARDFLRARAIPEPDVEKVWNAIALHLTPGIPEYMLAEIALVQAGSGMDVAGRGYEGFADEQRQTVVSDYPRDPSFKHGIIDAFYDGMKHRPHSTFGTFNDDVLASRIRPSAAWTSAVSSFIRLGNTNFEAHCYHAAGA